MTRAEGPAGAPWGCGGCCLCCAVTRRPQGGWPLAQSWPLLIEEMSPRFQGVSPSLWNQNWNQNTAFSLLRARLSQPAGWPSLLSVTANIPGPPACALPPQHLSVGEQQALTSQSRERQVGPRWRHWSGL